MAEKDETGAKHHSCLEEKVDRCLHLLHVLTGKVEKLMAVADDIKAALATLDTETTAIGANIAALAAKIKNSMTDAEVAEIQGSFGTLSTRLTTLAVDPTVPVPPPPPALAALRKKS